MAHHTGACFRALQIVEVVRMICTEFSERQRKDLVALARTSKIFSDPAFDVIWGRLTSLAPLVRCMPDTLWEEVVLDSKMTIIRQRRPILSTDIPRLLFYSVRVKELELCSDSLQGSVQMHFLKALDMCLAPHVLMPKLSEFTWRPETEGALSFIHHLLGSHSRTIDFDLRNAKSALSLFPYMKAMCPLVSQFTLVMHLNKRTIPSLSDLVSGWQHLQELSIGSLDKNGFIHIARLPALNRLCLSSVKDSGLLPLYLPDFISGTSFPALEDLDLSCEAPRFCIGLIRVISSRLLKTIRLHPLTDWTAVAWEEIHTTLHDCIDHEQLGEIDVGQARDRHAPADVTPYILTASTLRPLLAFKLHSIQFQLDPRWR